LNTYSLNDLLGGSTAVLFLCAVVWLYGKKNKAPFVFYIFFAYKILFSIFGIIILNSSKSGSDTSMFYTSTLEILDVDFNTYLQFLLDFGRDNYDRDYLSYFRDERSSYMLVLSNALIVKFGSILAFFFFKSYSALCFFFTTFSFFGTWYLFKGVTTLLNGKNLAIAQTILFVPSVAYWTSGFLKDGITFGSLGFLIYILIRVIYFKHLKFKYLYLFIIFSILIIVIKPYIYFAFTVSSIFLLIFEWTSNKWRNFCFLLVGTLLIYSIFMYGLSNVNLIFDIFKTTESMEFYESLETPGFVKFFEVDLSPSGILRMIFLSFFGVFYRPFIWESYNILMLISSIESTVLFILSLRFLYRYKFSFIEMKENSFLKFCLLFCLMFGIILGMTTFNYGTISRYKVPAVPLLFLTVVSASIRTKKISLKS
jgi:hypothetical protein